MTGRGENRRERNSRSGLRLVPERWGKGQSLRILRPEPRGRRRDDRVVRTPTGAVGSPHEAEVIMRMAFAIDVRDVVPAVKVPTLVLHRDRRPRLPTWRMVGGSPGRSRCSPSRASRCGPCAFIDADDILDEIQEFLTGVREPVEPERVLATVLFTDVVGSTERARELGDRRWRDLLDRHNEIVRRDLERFRGREVDTAGDGFFATFDGPARAIRCARSIVADVQSVGLEVRAGLHTGECELAGDQVRGIAVHTGARVASLAARGRGARVEHRARSRRRIGNRVRRPRRSVAQGDSGRMAALRRSVNASSTVSATSARSRASKTHESPASKWSASLK